MLPALSKIYEKALLNRIENYLYNNDFIDKHQFGFVSKSNILTACTHLINFVEMNLDNKKVVGSLFLDISKAFDSVKHTQYYL